MSNATANLIAVPSTLVAFMAFLWIIRKPLERALAAWAHDTEQRLKRNDAWFDGYEAGVKDGEALQRQRDESQRCNSAQTVTGSPQSAADGLTGREGRQVPGSRDDGSEGRVAG